MPDDPTDFDVRLRDPKLAALAEFAAGAGHEINNPVATILGRAQLLLQSEGDPAKRRSLATIASQALRIRDMIGDLMLFAHPPTPEPVLTDLAQIAADVCHPLAERATESGSTLTVRTDGPLAAVVDPLQLAVALSAVVENALNATGRGGRVTVSAQECDGVPILAVADDGPGFTDADREHAFDPFYSGRQAGRGLGFGLTKAWRIVALAGGTIEINSRPGDTLVTIAIPRPKAREGEAPAEPPTPDGLP